MQLALQEARKGRKEGGIPIGALLVLKQDDGSTKILGRGCNQRVQRGSPTQHGEIACLENAGRLPASIYSRCTMYTTLSPCPMCSGACVLFGIKRVVVGENQSFMGAEDYLKSEGVKLIVRNDADCVAMMSKFIQENAVLWNEDIGV